MQDNTTDFTQGINLTPAALPDFDSIPIQNASVNIGDIIMNGVNDPETFGRQLREEICRNGRTTTCIAEAISAKQLGRSGVGSARLY